LLSSSGRWANCGGCQPNDWYSIKCFGVEGSHSSPRITCEISIKWSSITFARWYTGKLSDFISTWSSRVSVSNTMVPRTMSFTRSFSPRGIFCLITNGSFAAFLASISSFVSLRQARSYIGACFNSCCLFRISSSLSAVQKHGYAASFAISSSAYFLYRSVLCDWI